eukprot:Sdes_comp20563_c0_seq2m15416
MESSLGELKETVLKTLSAQGVLSKIKTEIREAVFQALSSEDSLKPNEPLSPWVNSPLGRLAVEIILNYFDFQDLKYSKNMFLTETRLDSVSENTDPNFFERFGYSPETASKQPILLTLLEDMLRKDKNSVNSMRGFSHEKVMEENLKPISDFSEICAEEPQSEILEEIQACPSENDKPV